MLTTRRRAVCVLVAVLAMIGALSACSSSADPTSYIEKTYQRASNLDEDGIKAYTTTSKSPESVASDISANAEPQDRRTSSKDAAKDGGNAVFLQYSKKIVGIFPHEGGSKIMLGDYKRAHSHWFVFIGGFWGSSPNYGGGGSGNRGGGGGSGK